MNLTKEDLMILEEIINEEIHDQIDSGYKDNRITLSRNIDVTNKKICCLCKNCYSDLLDWLGINDCE